MVKIPVLVLRFLPAAGMALFPFIFVKSSRYILNKVLINHEKIHIRQQIELLILPFYIIYLLNYIVNLILYRSHGKAYLLIAFEKEAYANDSNLDYLKNRKHWAWTKHFRN